MTTDPHDATMVSLPELTKPMRNSKHWDQGVDWPLAGERAARLEREDQLRDALKRAADAEAQVKQWQTWGIVEIAVRNRSVADYMEHWEARALKAKAEAQVKALSRPLQELARASAKEICECFDIKVPRGVSYFNGILGTMAIIIETHLRGQSRDALIAARLLSAKEKP